MLLFVLVFEQIEIVWEREGRGRISGRVPIDQTRARGSTEATLSLSWGAVEEKISKLCIRSLRNDAREKRGVPAYELMVNSIFLSPEFERSDFFAHAVPTPRSLIV